MAWRFKVSKYKNSAPKFPKKEVIILFTHIKYRLPLLLLLYSCVHYLLLWSVVLHTLCRFLQPQARYLESVHVAFWCNVVFFERAHSWHNLVHHYSTVDFTFTLLLLFTTVLYHWDLSHRNFGLLSLGKACCDSHATQPTVHAMCISVSIIHPTLTWTTG